MKQNNDQNCDYTMCGDGLQAVHMMTVSVIMLTAENVYACTEECTYVSLFTLEIHVTILPHGYSHIPYLHYFPNCNARLSTVPDSFV